MSLYEELQVTLAEEPNSLKSEQLMSEIFWEVLEILENPSKNKLVRLSESASNFARQIFGRAKLEPITWQIWYAGQVQGIAGLLRTLLSRQLALETTAVLHSRKHSKEILAALMTADSRVTDLAIAVKLDESYLGRELKILSRHSLIETVKEGRERWVRITNKGRMALNEFPAVSSRNEMEKWLTEGVPAEDFSKDNAALNSAFPNLNKEEVEKSSKKYRLHLIAA